MDIKLDNTIAVLQQFADEVVEAYKSGLQEYDAITRGHHYLYDSVTSNPVEVNGSRMTVSINLAEYWKYVEDGRTAYGEDWRGHRPPISAITDWIEWKPYIAGSTPVLDPYKAVTPVLPREMGSTSDLSLAYAIATNIAKKGIEPKPILKNSVDSSLKKFREELLKALAADCGQVMAGEFAQLWSGVELKKVDGEWIGEDITDTLIL